MVKLQHQSPLGNWRKNLVKCNFITQISICALQILATFIYHCFDEIFLSEGKFLFFPHCELLTFLGEKNPTVAPSSLMATPISAKTASRWCLMDSVLFTFSSQVSFSSEKKKLQKLVPKKNSEFEIGTKMAEKLLGFPHSVIHTCYQFFIFLQLVNGLLSNCGWF